MCRFRGLGIRVVLMIILSAGVAYAGNDGVAEYGVSRGEPITDSFLFWNGKYVKAPYVVERRGLSIYINKILVKKAPQWAFYDYRVRTDPGNPPQKSSPFDLHPPGADVRNAYWEKKWRYLHSHFDHDKARQMMFETYKKSTEIKEVSWSDKADMVILVHKSGKKMTMDLSSDGSALGLTQEKKKAMVQTVEKERLSHENRLRGGVALFTKYRLSYIVPKEHAVEAIEILLSKKSKNKKISAMEQAGILKSGTRGTKCRWVVTDFKTGYGLTAHLARVKKIRAEEKKREEELNKAKVATGDSEPTLAKTPSPSSHLASGTENQETHSPPLASNQDKKFPVGHVVMGAIALIVVIGVVRFLRQRRLGT